VKDDFWFFSVNAKTQALVSLERSQIGCDHRQLDIDDLLFHGPIQASLDQPVDYSLPAPFWTEVDTADVG
jgi:hypothetical protein